MVRGGDDGGVGTFLDAFTVHVCYFPTAIASNLAVWPGCYYTINSRRKRVSGYYAEWYSNCASEKEVI